MLLTGMAMAQSCPQITSAQFLRTGFSSYSLTVNYTGGTGNINVMIFCLTNPVSGMPDVQCFQANGTGSQTITFSCFVEPFVMLVPTGEAICGQGTPCAIPYFVSSPSNAPVPIKLGSFTAARQDNEVLLTWESYTEVNAEKYIIERKTNGDYAIVAEITAANDVAGKRYTYSDLNTHNGVSQYRLKMVDIDGTYKYSEIRAVGANTGLGEITIFPNPTKGSGKVTLTDVNPAHEVQIFDHSGRMVKRVNMSHANTIDVSSLQNGMYMLRIIDKETGKATTKKLSVIN